MAGSDAGATSVPVSVPVPVSASAPPPPPPPPPSGRRPRAKYKSTYNAEVLARALHAVTKEGMSLRKAAANFGVPKTTLADKIGEPLERPLPKKSTRRKRFSWGEEDLREAAIAVEDGMEPRLILRHHGDPVGAAPGATQPGRQPDVPRNSTVRLTLTEERFIAAWAVALMELDVPPSKDEIYKLASKVVQKRCDKVLGKQWVSHWLRKYPSIKALDWEGKQVSRKSEMRLLSGETADSGALASQSAHQNNDQGGGQGEDSSDDQCEDELDELDKLARLDEQGRNTSAIGAQMQAGMDVMQAAL